MGQRKNLWRGEFLVGRTQGIKKARVSRLFNKVQGLALIYVYVGLQETPLWAL